MNIQGGIIMEVKTGYLYVIKDEFFDIVNDPSIMTNRGKSRPTYFTIKDKDILWFIPLSKQVAKYEKIINDKMEKHGSCDNIMIGEIAGEKSAILIQNTFPTLEKYISHAYEKDGAPVKVIDSLKDEILRKFKITINLKRKGKPCHME